MRISQDLTIESGGRITLPEGLLTRYGLLESAAVRVIETRMGILIVPLTDELMSEELREELEEWQALGAESLERFP
jgi:bifunctional DNA-binding transcriptional regulator/antitoxin component of YhaV-PrlF toxin-antitoxin module